MLARICTEGNLYVVDVATHTYIKHTYMHHVYILVSICICTYICYVIYMRLIVYKCLMGMIIGGLERLLG